MFRMIMGRQVCVDILRAEVAVSSEVWQKDQGRHVNGEAEYLANAVILPIALFLLFFFFFNLQKQSRVGWLVCWGFFWSFGQETDYTL